MAGRTMVAGAGSAGAGAPRSATANSFMPGRIAPAEVERAHEHLPQLVVQPGRPLRQDAGASRRIGTAASVWMHARDHFAGDAGEAEDVVAGFRPFPAEDFRTRVGARARRRLRRPMRFRRYSKVEQPDPAGIGQEDVRRLDVTMDDTEGVRMRKRVGNIRGDGSCIMNGQAQPARARRSRAASVSPVKQLHDDEPGPVIAVEIVEPHDIRVRRGLGLAELALQAGDAARFALAVPAAATSPPRGARRQMPHRAADPMHERLRPCLRCRSSFRGHTGPAARFLQPVLPRWPDSTGVRSPGPPRPTQRRRSPQRLRARS